MMRKNALRFLVDLSKDAQKREAFQRNPGAVLESAGISDEEAKAVLGGGDPNAIRQYLGAETSVEEPPVLVLVMS
ncbi:MAG TPA: hypothetical protein VLT87_05430 [Thermoanaerobaculia bacterium]|nr:hypothetical protein [Thermoanaerobaculia bacterium]